MLDCSTIAIGIAGISEQEYRAVDDLTLGARMAAPRRSQTQLEKRPEAVYRLVLISFQESSDIAATQILAGIIYYVCT